MNVLRKRGLFLFGFLVLIILPCENDMKFMLNPFKSDLPINVNLKIQMKCGNTSNTLTGKNPEQYPDWEYEGK